MRHYFKCLNEKEYVMFDNDTYQLCLFDSKFSDELSNKQNDLYKIINKNVNNYNKKIKEQNFDDISIYKDIKNCNRLIINLTSKCNLSCKYCYAERGKYANCNMDNSYENNFNAIKHGIDKVFLIYDEGVNYVQFFGGEPLLNFELMVKCIYYIEDKCKNLSLKLPKYIIVTNGTILNECIIDLFKNKFDSVTISLDGDSEINDYNRIYDNMEQRGTYDTIVKNIKLLKNSGVYICIESTISKLHIDEFMQTGEISLYLLAKELGVDRVTVSPLIDFKTGDISLKKCNINNVINFFDEWAKINIKDKLYQGKSFVVIPIIRKIINKSHDLFGCGAMNSDICIDVNGRLYPCFMFCGEEIYCQFDTLDDINILKKQLNILRNNLRKPFLEDKCQLCWLRYCGCIYSHCVGSRFLSSKDIYNNEPLGCKISEVITMRILYEIAKYYKIKEGKYEKQII